MKIYISNREKNYVWFVVFPNRKRSKQRIVYKKIANIWTSGIKCYAMVGSFFEYFSRYCVITNFISILVAEVVKEFKTGEL